MIAYALDGYFGTKSNTAYLNDIIARFLISFRDYKPTRVSSSIVTGSRASSLSTSLGTYTRKIYKLKELQELKSLSSNKLPRAAADKFEDFTFWAIKFHCEDLIKSQGIPTSEQLIQFAISNFEGKEYSTLKAKCRSIWHYYEKRNWSIPKPYKKKPKEQVLATRQEHIEKVNKNREQQNRNKIKAILDDIFLQDNIKFKNGKYRIGEIAKIAEIHRETVAKYLKEFNLI